MRRSVELANATMVDRNSTTASRCGTACCFGYSSEGSRAHLYKGTASDRGRAVRSAQPGGQPPPQRRLRY